MTSAMRHVPVEHDINIAIIGLLLVPNLHQEQAYMAMLISCFRGDGIFDHQLFSLSGIVLRPLLVIFYFVHFIQC